MSILSRIPHDIFKYALLFLATPEHDNVLKAIRQKKIQHDYLLSSEVLEAAVYANLHDQLFCAQDMLNKFVFPFIADIFETLGYVMDARNFMIIVNVIRNMNIVYARGLMYDHETKTMEPTQLETTIESIATLSCWFHNAPNNNAPNIKADLEEIIDQLDMFRLELQGLKMAVLNREVCTVRFANALLHLVHCSSLCPHASLI